MKLIHFLLPLAMLLSCGCSAKTSATNRSDHEVRVGDWSSIVANGTYNITVKHRPDSTGFLRVCTQKSIFDRMKFTVNDGTLIIVTENGSRYNGPIHIVAYTDGNMTNAVLSGSGNISLPDLNVSGQLSLVVNGSGNIKSKSLKATDITAAINGSGDIEISKTVASGTISLAVSGSGDIEVKNIKAGTVNAATHGSGDIKLSGKTDNANLAVYGSGDIDAARLKTQNLSADANGSGGITYGDARKVNTRGKNVRQSKKIKN